MKQIKFFGLLVLVVVLNAQYKTNAQASNRDLTTEAPFDFPEMDIKIDSLRTKYDIPGISVAIIRNDKLVYINCYGNQDSITPVRNNSLFRIASISKPITVVALLKLMQEGKLSIDDKVFGENSILGEDFGPLPAEVGWEKITVRHLIEHKSGIQNVPNDPMFAYRGLSNKEIISSIIAERKLSSEPGEVNYYSNTGYNILGRVIEKITGETYEEYVKTKILAPCGITNMKIGLNTFEQRFENEVAYDQPNEPGWPYRMDVYRMDSHGGWIASAADLARFIAHTDRVETVNDIVDKEWLKLTYFGFERWNHTGSLPGTATMLMRVNDEFSFVFLSNSRSGEKEFWQDISSTMTGSIESCKSWPDIDLFEVINW